MHDELHKTVTRLDNAVFGDRDDPKGSPGIISEQARMGMEQARTNEILLELRNSVRWINGLIITGFVTALVGIVFRT
jgi:hypothetical protein